MDSCHIKKNILNFIIEKNNTFKTKMNIKNEIDNQKTTIGLDLIILLNNAENI